MHARKQNYESAWKEELDKKKIKHNKNVTPTIDKQ